MRTSQLLIVCITFVVGAHTLAGQDASIKQLCSEHPATARGLVVKARNTGHGIQEQYSLDLAYRPPGREVTVLVDTGGGDCPVESTSRGNAAAAVGALLYNGQIHCSAVLVSSSMILTAAHCIRGFDENKLEFVLGLDSGRPVQRASIYSADVNPRYDENHFGVNDIGYAYLNSQMTEATPVQLPDSTLSRTPNISVLHVGYGISGPKAGARRCVNIPVLDRCDDSFSYSTKNMNTCNGDSGGAAFRDLTDKIVLVGLTDWGDDACADFGVDIDVGNYLDWIQARKGLTPPHMAYARVEPWARKQLNLGPDDVSSQLGLAGFGAESKFNSLFKGRWITWDARVEDVSPPNEDEFPGSCSVLAKAGQSTHLRLRQYPDGCALSINSGIRFTGRLARLASGGLDVVLVEPVMPPSQAVNEVTGEYKLVRLTRDKEEVRERRSRSIRLESRHGSWSGRVTGCLPVPIEAPWHLDQAAPIEFTPAHHDHAGYQGMPQNLSEQGFCVPLWAEGYGGTQAFGATLDAGMVGVISGTIEFGVVKSDSTVVRVPVTAGPIANTGVLNIPLPSLDQYEVQLKLRDGKEQTFSDSGSLGTVSVNWADGKVVVRSGSQQQ
jgi:hypothetical protein